MSLLSEEIAKLGKNIKDLLDALDGAGDDLTEDDFMELNTKVGEK